MNNRQKIFIDEYLKCFNASEAARRAGYSEKTARVIGQQNLLKLAIKTIIDDRIAASQMSADEALKRTSDIARFNIGSMLDNNGFLDIENAQKSGLLSMVKKIKQKRTIHKGKTENEKDIVELETEVEIYDGQAAIRDMLRVHGKFKDKVDVSGALEYVLTWPEQTEIK